VPLAAFAVLVGDTVKGLGPVAHLFSFFLLRREWRGGMEQW